MRIVITVISIIHSFIPALIHKFLVILKVDLVENRGQSEEHFRVRQT